MSTSAPRYDDINLNDELPPQSIDLTVSLIVAGAVASNDYTPVHHDKKAAQATGMQDVFMNILTTNGLVSRFVTDWSGVDSRITNLSVKLGTPNLPGDTMTLTGKVSDKVDASHAVVVDVTGKNSWGNHVTGTVKVILDQEA